MILDVPALPALLILDLEIGSDALGDEIVHVDLR